MSSLLNVSESTFLALHGMVILAKAAPDKVRVKTIALELKASEAHLAKVFQKLSKAGLVRSLRGPAGGYSLVDSPENTSFLNIYEAIESKINIEVCPFGKSECMYDTCIFDSSITELATHILDTFRNIKLSKYL